MNQKPRDPSPPAGNPYRWAAGLLSLALIVPDAAQASVLQYTFNQTGSSVPSIGTNTTAVTMHNDAGTATDLHSPDALGVSGLPGDRAYANLGPNDHGSVAGAATNGFRANQAADLNAIDQFTSFTLSGWFKTETAITLVGKTPRLFWNHNDGGASGAGFNLQFLSGSEDLKLDIDNDTASVNTTGGQFSDKQTWVFFAVTYDGTIASNNVKFYKGYRTDSEALLGTTQSTANVILLSTATLDRGTVNTETTALVIGNRTAGDRPFDGYLDEMRIDGVQSGNTGALPLAALEAIRLEPLPVVPEPGSLALALCGAAMFGVAVVRAKRKSRRNG